jgi:hypothetical protein
VSQLLNKELNEVVQRALALLDEDKEAGIHAEGFSAVQL